MAQIEVATDEGDIRRNLAGLGLPYAPVSFAPARDPDEPSSPEPRPRAGRGPPPLDLRPDDVAVPPPVDESGDPPWSDDCPPPPDDDTSQVPPDDEI